MSDFTETQVDVHTEYRLVTEYAPGQFSVRMRGTYQDVLTQHAEDQADTVIAGVVLIADEYPDEPYDDGQSPLLRLDINGYRGNRAEHVMATGRPLDDDARIEQAAERWGSDFRLLEKYLRACYGVTKVETWHSGSYWYVTYDPAAWREHVGAPAGSVDMSEYRAYCEGDVWGYAVERRVTWKPVDAPADDDVTMQTWETVDSCFGFYGSDGANGEYLRETALEAFESACGPPRQETRS
jgi:hypothetical protein